ncbi:MAG: alpha-ketoglutarate-dependent dioxygenase AlkB [Chitinophagaceae bacterium]
MELFDTINDSTKNILPCDGEAYYYGKIISTEQSTLFFDQLLANVNWVNDETTIFGKKIITKRKTAWYGDAAHAYTYSGHTRIALPWTSTLLQLKQLMESHTGHLYNSCLLNLYHNGTEGMGWHSDAEKELEKDGAIASFSLGAERKFIFKHKASGLLVPLMLQQGSLLLMKGVTQTHWLHRLAPQKAVLHPRINLTFRTIRVLSHKS